MRSPVRVQLGCGEVIIPNWINVDLRVPKAFQPAAAHLILADVSLGLPLRDTSVDVIYASHVWEHLGPFEESEYLVKECHRVLRPGGVLRVSVPDFRVIALHYLAGSRSFYEEYGYQKPWFGKARSWSRRLGITVMYDHKMLYDCESLTEVLSVAPFERIECMPDYYTSTLPGHLIAEIPPTHVTHSLVCEAIKGAAR